LPDKELAFMKQTIGYTKFAMSYRDMAIVNMAIMKNIYWEGNKIHIAGKPVYEVYLEFQDDAKENMLKFIRIAYAREIFNIIDRIWSRMNMERSMINYPEFYWLPQIAMVKKSIVCKEIKQRVDCLEDAEHALCLKNLLQNRMEKVLVLWNSAFKSLGVSYKNEMLTPKEILQLREWKQASTRLDRSTLELQLSMCGVLHFNLQNAPFSDVVKMVEE
jgi:hypothetical protein